MTLRDVNVEYGFDDPDDGWFGWAQPVDLHPSLVDPSLVDPSLVEASTVEASGSAEYDAQAQSAAPAYDPMPVYETAAPSYETPPVYEPAVLPDETAAPDAEYLPPDEAADTDRWHVRDLETAMAAHTPAVAALTTRAPANGRAGTPPSTWESRLSQSGAWDFKVSDPHPGNRSKLVLITLIAVAVIGAVVALVVFLTGDSASDQDAPRVAPSGPTAEPVQPTPKPVPSASSRAPAPPPAPALPPPPPPPPPPSAEQVSPPVTRQYSPPQRQYTPEVPKKPEIGVTRTPTTRAPMSATPPPPPRPDRNSATPGDSPKGGGWGW